MKILSPFLLLLILSKPYQEVLRIIATFRQDPASLASVAAIAELQNKLPNELGEGPQPLKLDALTLSTAIEEAEGVLLSRISAMEPLRESIGSTSFVSDIFPIARSSFRLDSRIITWFMGTMKPASQRS